MTEATAETPTNTRTEPTRTRYPIEDWLTLKRAYIHCKGTIKDMATKLGINIQTAYERAENEQWGKLRAKWREREEARIVAQEPVPETPPAIPTVKPGSHWSESQAEAIQAQIKVIDNLFSTETDAKALSSLVKAKAELLNSLALCTGFPKPGTRRVPRQSHALRSPSAPVPIPDQG